MKSSKKSDHHDGMLHTTKDLAVIAFCLAGVYAALKIATMAKEAVPLIEQAKKSPMLGGGGN